MSLHAARENGFLRFLRNSVGILFALIIASDLFVGPWLEFRGKKWMAVYALPFMLVAVGICIAVLAVSRHFSLGERLSKVSKRSFAMYLAISTCVLLAAQAVIVVGARFVTGWDVGTLTAPPDQAATLAPYFSQYPNQIFLYSLFCRLGDLASVLGIGRYSVLVVCSCISVTASLTLMGLIAEKLWGTKVAIPSHLLGCVFIGLSPWILVPYSDSYGMLMPTAALFFYICANRTGVKLAGSTACALMGYFIKPTCIFVLMAIVIVEVVDLLHQRAKVRLRSALKVAGCVVMGAAVVLVLRSAVTIEIPGINKAAAFSMTHFLMMGSAEETGGMWNGDDVAASASMSDPSERSKMNLQVFADRVKSRTPLENIRFGVQKTLSNFDDGTFGWELEGSFYMQDLGRINALKKYYGTFTSGPLDGVAFEGVSQVLWFAVLTGIPMLALSRRSKARAEDLAVGVADEISARRATPAAEKAEVVMLLSLAMLAVFLLLFECRARYLFLYAPYFVLLGVRGWDILNSRLRGADAPR